jgi:GntR family transcriptional regulator
MRASKSDTDYLFDRPSRPAPLSRSAPAYLQIEEQLADRIASGEFAYGERLPPERELTKQLGVSRMTVRAAMDRLAQRNLIVRREGSGTFVAEPKLRQDTRKLRGFFEDTVGEGESSVSRLLAREDVLATRHLARVLDVSVGEPLYRNVRIRISRGVPVVLETSYFPAAIVPGLHVTDLERSSIDRLLGKEFNARPVRARQSLEVTVAQGVDADVLGIAVGSPVLLVERVSWDALDRTVEYARDLYRPDRSRFVTELTL